MRSPTRVLVQQHDIWSCSCALGPAAAVLRADHRKRLAGPLGPAAAVADVAAGAAVTSLITSSPCTFNICSCVLDVISYVGMV